MFVKTFKPFHYLTISNKYTMKILFLPLIFMMLACAQPKVQLGDVLVENHLKTNDEIDGFKELLIRDVGRLAKKANHKTKTDSKFDEHYSGLVNNHNLMFYYPSKTSDTIYFALSRIAPSLHEKKVAIGGKVILNEKKEITFLEETFRTFKMPVDELTNKTGELFLTMVNHESLKSYEYKNSKPEEFIEFPDEFTIYNTDERKWDTTREMYYGS